MGNRFSRAKRQRLYDQILARADLDECGRCGKKPEREYGLTLEHIDGNRDRHDLDNLRLLCASCNTKGQMEERARKAKLWEAHRNPSNPTTGARRTPSPKGGRVVERERETESLTPQQKRDRAVRPDEGSPEMRASEVYRTVYRNWLDDQLSDEGKVSKEDAIYSGAFVVGCSSQTTERYLRIWCSPAGDLEEVADATGLKVIRCKRPV